MRTTLEVRRYMRSVRINHADTTTNEVDMTSLAEDAAHAFDCDSWLDDDTHWVWDLAFNVAEEYEDH